MPGKRKSKPKVIEASQIVLKDASGKARIVLDGGGDHGYAHILVASPDWRGSMQVGTQPSGAVVMSFGTKEMDGMLTISEGGIVLRARDGNLGVVIGPIVDGHDDIIIYRNGLPVWKSPSKIRRRRAGPKTKQLRKNAKKA